MTFPSKYRNSNGLGYTKALFLETAQPSQSDLVVYTLRDEDHKGYDSLYRLYMKANDPTEYQFAIQNFDGWSHWEDVSLCTFMKPYIERWRRELEVRTRSRALSSIAAQAASPNSAKSVPANKYLLSGEWLPKDRRAGRPSKEAVQKETKRLAEVERQVTEDLERVSN